MDMPLPANIKLLFDHEVLRARLEIRDFFLKNLFREVYENIGQILSLARYTLAGSNARTEAASNLVGQAIRDLRQMCKSFYPDTDLLAEEGMKKGITGVVDILYPGSQQLLQIKHAADEMETGLKLILFNLLLSVLSTVSQYKGSLAGVNIDFTATNFEFAVSYTGADISFDGIMSGNSYGNNVFLQQRAALINANFEQHTDNTGTTHIKLLPL